MISKLLITLLFTIFIINVILAQDLRYRSNCFNLEGQEYTIQEFKELEHDNFYLNQLGEEALKMQKKARTGGITTLVLFGGAVVGVIGFSAQSNMGDSPNYTGILIAALLTPIYCITGTIAIVRSAIKKEKCNEIVKQYYLGKRSHSYLQYKLSTTGIGLTLKF